MTAFRTWRSRLPASIATWFSRELVRPALELVEAGGVGLRAVEEARIDAVVTTNGRAPEVTIEWGGGTGPQGLRSLCSCGASGVCAHAIAALETVRTHADEPAEEATRLDWLPDVQPPDAGVPRARSVWPVFSVADGRLVCTLFLDTPRLRGVLRDADQIATMVEQTPADDWDENDRSLIRDAPVRDAVGARAAPRALAQLLFRLARHPRVRFDDRPEAGRHPAELSRFAVDPRGVRVFATFAGALPVPVLETYDGRRLDPARAVVVDGPPAWLADIGGAYLLGEDFDASKARRALEAARGVSPQLEGRPSAATLARVAPFLAGGERAKLGIVEALDTSARLTAAWKDGALVARVTLVDRATRASAALGSRREALVGTTANRLVWFSSEIARTFAERLFGAGFVPNDGAFALHGAERAARFLREVLPSWDDVELELDPSLESVSRGRALDVGVAVRRTLGRRDWFDVDIEAFVPGDDERPLSRDELLALLRPGPSAERYADVRGRLVDVGALREREGLLSDLLGRKRTGLAALVALRDEIHAAFGRAELPEEVEALRERLRNFQGIARVAPPPSVARVLRGYQERGLDFLAYLGEFGFGGILADDMGVGKSLQALSYLLHRKEREGPAPSLVIAPTSVTHTWESEIAKFTPELTVLRLSSGNERAARYDAITHHDVVVTSYALARLDAEKLASIHFRAIILDEAQNAKNPSSQISRVVRSLRADHRLALTGTPVENSLRDLWAIFAFLEPGLLGTEASFRRRFEAPIAAGDALATGALHARLEPFVLRRTKEDVAPELPPRTEVEIAVDLSPAQRVLYRAIAEAARREIAEIWDETGEEKASIHVLAALTRLRQVCAHPGLLSEKYLAEPEASAKLDALLETIDEVIDGRHKVLVFSSFASMLRIVRTELERRSIGFAYLDGTTKEKDRRGEIERFMRDDGPPVFLCSLKAGGVGLTLTAADYVVLYDPWWNPAVERQAIDRTHRIGQRRAVTAYRLIARGSVEEKIRELAARKREISQNVIRTDAALAKTLSRGDLEFLLSGPE